MSVFASSSQYISSPFKVLIDYRRPLADMIATGKYDWVDKQITRERFPSEADGIKEVELEVIQVTHLKKPSMTAMTTLASLERCPASLPELCAIGAAEPDLQRDFNILALGSTWLSPGGMILAPYLHGGKAGRGLRLRDADAHDWVANCRLLVFSK